MKSFFRFLLPIMCALVIAVPVFAQTASESALTDQTASESFDIQYDLPYPGILPDNILYPLKTFRDRVVSMLITDPIKRTEFYLLNSDKRIHAGIMLLDKKKYDLAITTISKSTNYMYEAVTYYEKIPKNKREPGLLGKMNTSIQKHQELIEKYAVVVPKQYHKPLQTENKRLEEMEQLALKLENSKRR